MWQRPAWWWKRQMTGRWYHSCLAQVQQSNDAWPWAKKKFKPIAKLPDLSPQIANQTFWIWWIVEPVKLTLESNQSASYFCRLLTFVTSILCHNEFQFVFTKFDELSPLPGNVRFWFLTLGRNMSKVTFDFYGRLGRQEKRQGRRRYRRGVKKCEKGGWGGAMSRGSRKRSRGSKKRRRKRSRRRRRRKRKAAGQLCTRRCILRWAMTINIK